MASRNQRHKFLELACPLKVVPSRLKYENMYRDAANDIYKELPVSPPLCVDARELQSSTTISSLQSTTSTSDSTKATTQDSSSSRNNSSSSSSTSSVSSMMEVLTRQASSSNSSDVRIAPKKENSEKKTLFKVSGKLIESSDSNEKEATLGNSEPCPLLQVTCKSSLLKTFGDLKLFVIIGYRPKFHSHPIDVASLVHHHQDQSAETIARTVAALSRDGTGTEVPVAVASLAVNSIIPVYNRCTKTNAIPLKIT